LRPQRRVLHSRAEAGKRYFGGASFGGSVIQKVAEEIPSLIERTVFPDAPIVEDGHSVFDELPAEYVALFNDLARASSDNTMLIPWKVWRDNFIQDAPEFGARSLWEQLSPEPESGELGQVGSETILLARHSKELYLLPPR
jgi:hypothetical protein